MNPQSDQTPGLRLPQPSFNVGQAPAPSAPAGYQMPQQMPAQPQGMPMPAPQAMTPMAQQPATAPMPGAVSIAPQQPAPTATPAELAPASAPVQEAVQADDEGALDQEWVTKAREVVERTHTDPYTLSNELGKIKAQYIKVRYNKDIKVVED